MSPEQEPLAESLSKLSSDFQELKTFVMSSLSSSVHSTPTPSNDAHEKANPTSTSMEADIIRESFPEESAPSNPLQSSVITIDEDVPSSLNC